jgi:hypothetical protein
MCDLCDKDKESVNKERRRLLAIAERLEDHARNLTWLATGTFKPHSDAASNVSAEGVRLIGILVREWL